MLSQIFKDMKGTRDKGGVHMTLDFGEMLKHDVVSIPVIQFIIGHRKYNDIICGRKVGHC